LQGRKKELIYEYTQKTPFYPMMFGYANDIYVVSRRHIEKNSLDAG